MKDSLLGYFEKKVENISSFFIDIVKLKQEIKSQIIVMFLVLYLSSIES